MSLKDTLIRHEGLSLTLYHCPEGRLTIGVGRNLEDIGISKQEAMVLLENDIRRCQTELEVALPFTKFMPDEKRDVLLNMLFNMGLTRFLGFKKMILALERSDWAEASKEMLDSKWARQVPNRALELAEKMKGPVISD